MFVVPFNTDAPIYYRPWGTIGLVVANVVIFAATVANPNLALQCWLPYGEGLTPFAWVTSNFIHGGIMHLLGNMLFLWGFGLVVEGKIGWQRFIPLYFAIGLLECAFEQTLFLHSHGGSYGASAILFGLMTICLLWAPQNELSVFYIFLIRGGIAEIPIVWFSGLMLLWSVFMAFLSGGISSEALHLFGAAIGGVLGWILLRKKLVDCEGWDLVTLWRGGKPSLIQARSKAKAKRMKKSAREMEVPKLSSTARFSELVEHGKFKAAFAELQKIRHLRPDWQPTLSELSILARELRRQREWTAAVALYSELIQRQPDDHLGRLEVAEILTLVQQRPSAARKFLSQCEGDQFTPRQRARLEQVQSRIRFLLESGVIELDTGTF